MAVYCTTKPTGYCVKLERLWEEGNVWLAEWGVAKVFFFAWNKTHFVICQIYANEKIYIFLYYVCRTTSYYCVYLYFLSPSFTQPVTQPSIQSYLGLFAANFVWWVQWQESFFHSDVSMRGEWSTSPPPPSLQKKSALHHQSVRALSPQVLPHCKCQHYKQVYRMNRCAENLHC